MSIMSIEFYFTVVIPEYTAADLNKVIRALHDLRDRLRDDHKARQTVEMGRTAATDLDGFCGPRPSTKRSPTSSPLTNLATTTPEKA